MRVTAADILVAGCAAVLGAADVRLIRHGGSPVTATLRRPLVLTCWLVLTAHVLDVLGPFDPFRLIARRIPRR